MTKLTGFVSSPRVHGHADRQVHARVVSNDGSVLEIVRYDRGGRWYSEADGVRLRCLSVREAAQVTLHLLRERFDGVEVYSGLPGGRTFDRIVRAGSPQAPDPRGAA